MSNLILLTVLCKPGTCLCVAVCTTYTIQFACVFINLSPPSNPHSLSPSLRANTIMANLQPGHPTNPPGLGVPVLPPIHSATQQPLTAAPSGEHNTPSITPPSFPTPPTTFPTPHLPPPPVPPPHSHPPYTPTSPHDQTLPLLPILLSSRAWRLGGSLSLCHLLLHTTHCLSHKAACQLRRRERWSQ